MNVTKNKIKNLQTGKKIHDGRGLYFFKKGDKGRWSFRYQRYGKCHEMGCGPYPEISIPMARERHESYKKMLSCGLDPITEKRKEEAKRKVINTKYFSDLAKVYIESTHFTIIQKAMSHIDKALEDEGITIKEKAEISIRYLKTTTTYLSKNINEYTFQYNKKELEKKNNREDKETEKQVDEILAEIAELKRNSIM